MQQALQERGAAEERYQAQLAGLAGELEQTRQVVAHLPGAAALALPARACLVQHC